MPPSRSGLLSLAHRQVAAALAPGGWAVDATAGNGHDTALLAEAVGAEGHVWAFDVQAEALRATRRRLTEQGLAERVTLLEQGHETMSAALPSEAAGRVGAVTFNLGYLPGGPDKSLTTRPETTRRALDAAASLLASGGVMTIVCYTGHPGGAEEARAVRRWAASLAQARFRVMTCRYLGATGDPPHLLIVERRAAAGA